MCVDCEGLGLWLMISDSFTQCAAKTLRHIISKESKRALETGLLVASLPRYVRILQVAQAFYLSWRPLPVNYVAAICFVYYGYGVSVVILKRVKIMLKL